MRWLFHAAEDGQQHTIMLDRYGATTTQENPLEMRVVHALDAGKNPRQRVTMLVWASFQVFRLRAADMGRVQ